MLGNDHRWNYANFGNESQILLLKPHETPAVDMCLLSRCDHVIITTGTFGWWAAYFNVAGMKIYPKQQVRPNSFLANAAEPYETYFPPDWIGL